MYSSLINIYRNLLSANCSMFWVFWKFAPGNGSPKQRNHTKRSSIWSNNALVCCLCNEYLHLFFLPVSSTHAWYQWLSLWTLCSNCKIYIHWKTYHKKWQILPSISLPAGQSVYFFSSTNLLNDSERSKRVRLSNFTSMPLWESFLSSKILLKIFKEMLCTWSLDLSFICN